MKILIVISTPEMGGAQRVSFNLAKWVNMHSDDEICIVALGKSSRNAYKTTEYDYEELQKGNRILQLRTIVKRKSPDIVLTMGVPLALYTVPALLGLGVKHVISERNDPAHFAGKKTTRFFSRLLMRFADGFVFQTKQAQAYYCKNIGKRSVVIHNPLYDVPQTVSERELKRNEIVSVGRLNKQKNQKLLICAFEDIHKMFPTFRLIIYGEGPERRNLENYIKELNLDKYILLPGSVNDILDRIRDSYMFVMTSDFEGMPNALMEAMSLGLPCISTDCPCGGPAELIVNQINGRLVPVGDKDSLINAMKEMIENKRKAEDLGREARRICDSHSIDKICNEWYNYFVKIVES